MFSSAWLVRIRVSDNVDAMSTRDAAAFWSYAHEDNRLDKGNIVTLAKNLSNEFSLNTGRELELFLDCESLDWGNEWRKRIDGALANASFLMPILTPRYFQRAECRREALSFYGKAKSLGLEDLLLPILYAPVPDFDESNSDELISMMSRYQYVDWRGLRLEGPESVDYRKAVHQLSQRLISLESDINEKRLIQEISDAQDDAEALADAGFLDIMEKIEILLPEWTENLESRDVSYAQYVAVRDLYLPRLNRLETTPGNAGPRFALTQRLAKEELPLAERYMREAEIYAKKSMELDPLMLQVLRLVERDPDIAFSMQFVENSLRKANANIIRADEFDSPGSVTGYEWARARAHISRLVKKMADVYERAEQFTREGNEIVRNWVIEWERVTGSSLSMTSE